MNQSLNECKRHDHAAFVIQAPPHRPPSPRASLQLLLYIASPPCPLPLRSTPHLLIRHSPIVVAAGEASIRRQATTHGQRCGVKDCALISRLLGTLQIRPDLGGRAAGLVDLERVDEPVGVGEGGRVVLHVILACGGKSRARGVLRPDVSGPLFRRGQPIKAWTNREEKTRRTSPQKVSSKTICWFWK